VGHYNSWKYIVDNNLDSCLILEDGVEFLRDDFANLKLNKNLHILFINEEMNRIDANKNLVGYGLQGLRCYKKRCCFITKQVSIDGNSHRFTTTSFM